ncbi:MAG: type II toxin-antitoxin system HicB family antitoxin [Calditrichaceae bacterium]|nr:type II toxin-antitoxin system HicB family antitoxin [Calditrichia bacterium]NUQ41660.1 type II toxin-antitoxin system HicB family antitoxin [Calditrichaceae bacterium]
MENTFTAIIKKINGGYVGYAAELPGANTQGETVEETLENLKEAIVLVLQANREITEATMGGEVIRETIKVSA